MIVVKVTYYEETCDEMAFHLLIPFAIRFYLPKVQQPENNMGLLYDSTLLIESVDSSYFDAV